MHVANTRYVWVWVWVRVEAMRVAMRVLLLHATTAIVHNACDSLHWVWMPLGEWRKPCFLSQLYDLRPQQTVGTDVPIAVVESAI